MRSDVPLSLHRCAVPAPNSPPSVVQTFGSWVTAWLFLPLVVIFGLYMAKNGTDGLSDLVPGRLGSSSGNVELSEVTNATVATPSHTDASGTTVTVDPSAAPSEATLGAEEGGDTGRLG